MQGDNCAELREGLVIAGRWRLDERLGEGAAGDVWRAKDLELASPAAIKFLAPRLRRVQSHVASFLHEATLAKRVDCEHVVRVMECGLSLQIGPYIVMDLVEGLDLFEHLVRSGPLPTVEMAAIVAQVSVALEALHAANVFHRDVKPENVVLTTRRGRRCAALIDFGVAKEGRTAADAATEACSSGTPSYMSPERLAGSAGADAQSDLWSLAVVGYQCLVGRMPFDVTTLAAGRVTFALPSAFRADVPSELDAWFRRSFAPLRSERFASAVELREALIGACSPFPLESRSSQAEHASPRGPRASGTRSRFFIEEATLAREAS